MENVVFVVMRIVDHVTMKQVENTQQILLFEIIDQAH